MEALKSDLRGAQTAVKELLARAEGGGGALKRVPSWRFPEKPAASLNAEELAREVTHSGADSEADCKSHVLLLELVVDR